MHTRIAPIFTTGTITERAFRGVKTESEKPRSPDVFSCLS
jgi:hypothetical protein